MVNLNTTVPASTKANLDEDLADKKTTERQKFIQQLVTKQQEHTKKHTPFCYRCAKIDYIEEQERIWRKDGIKAANKPENVKVNPDLKQYENLDRFVLIKEDEIIENKLIDGLRQPTQTGMFRSFKCKERNCNHAIEIPLPKQESIATEKTR